MGDGDAQEADLDRLEALDDDALTRLAYDRADSATDRMLAQRAARILASRRPTPPLSPVAGSAPRRDSPSVGAELTASDDDDEEEGLETRREDARRRWRAAAAAGVAIAVLATAITLTLPRTPAAFAIFDDESSASESEFAALLANAGERLLSPARVIATTPLTDGGRLDLVAYRQGREGDPAERREACVTLFGMLGEPGASPRRWDRSCVPEEAFLSGGIAGTLELTGVEIRYAWPASASDPETGLPLAPALAYEPTGPTSVAEALALGGEALGALRPSTEAEPPPLVASIMTVVRPTGPVLLGPTELTRVGDDEAILIGYVTPGSLPGAELSVCAVAVRLGVAWGEIDERCVPVSTFAAVGLGTQQSPNAGVGTFSYRWEPWGQTSLIVLRPGDS